MEYESTGEPQDFGDGGTILVPAMAYGSMGRSQDPASAWVTGNIEFLMFGIFFFTFLVFFAFVVFHVRALWKIQQGQRGILAALEAMGNTHAEVAEALQNIRAAKDAGAADDLDPDDDGGAETPADFVYCPECSTRVEVDPFVRNINVVCPDCKKPFHIH